MLNRPLSSYRRGSGATALLLLLIGVVMLAIGIAIGRGLNTAKDAQAENSGGSETRQVAATTETAGETDANTGTQSASRVPSFDEDDEDALADLAGHDHSHAAADGDDDTELLPPVEFDPPVLDFGTVAPGRLVSGVVNIRNAGDEPLFIEASKASCSCTAVDMSNTWIQPGESVPMEATFTKQSLGDKKAAVRLKFRGYDNVATVNIKAMVAMKVMAIPAYVYAEFDPETDSTLVSSGQFTVRSMDKKPFRILAINGEEPNYINFNPATDEPRDVYEIGWDLSDVDDRTCRRADGKKPRRFWVVETDHPECPVFDMQVRHRCTLPEPLENRRWVLSPQRVLLGEMTPGESTSIDVLMKWLPRSAHNEEIYTVLPESPYIKVDVLDFERAHGNGREDTVRLRVTISADHPEGMLYEKVRVHSRSSSAPFYLLGRVAR